ncbi:MAG: class I SAM-dependent methyltransferase [Aeromicrobium erythreum]
MEEYLEVNRAQWDSRVDAHRDSRAYDLDRYRRDPDAISDVVRFDVTRLGDLTGLRTVHLQCHIGTDTLSLHRLGAHVTGLDLSPRSLEVARELAADTGATIDYVETDTYSATEVLEPGSFDLVYTGIGAICWLPSIERWARTVAALLRPGGRLFIRDMHPMLGVLEEHDGALTLDYPYFEHEEPLVWEDTVTYVDHAEPLPGLPTREWSHGLAETVMAVTTAGLSLDLLVEHDSVPWEPFPGLMAPHPDLPGEHRLADRPERLAASFTLAATKRPA